MTNNAYVFNRFKGQGPSNENKISINKSYEITFPSVFCSENNIFNYKYVVLYWDSKKRAIGIQFTNNEEELGRLTLKQTSKGGGARISVKGFLTTNKINPLVHAGRYSWIKYPNPETGTLYVFELEKK